MQGPLSWAELHKADAKLARLGRRTDGTGAGEEPESEVMVQIT